MKTQKLTFSEKVIIKESNDVIYDFPMKTHDGIHILNQKFQYLIILYLNNKFIDVLLFLEILTSGELELFQSKIGKLIKNIFTTGRTPILEKGGGLNKIISVPAEKSLYDLIGLLGSIIDSRNMLFSMEAL